MVLKDAYCVKCGREQELFCEGAETVVQAFCEHCDRQRTHKTICCGNTRYRYRFNDAPSDMTGYVSPGGVYAGFPHPDAVDTPDESRSATPDMHISGVACHDRERFSERVRDERRAERADRRRSADGKAPLYFNT